MKIFSISLLSFLMSHLTSFSQNRLVWSSAITHPSTNVVECKRIETDNDGISFTINYTESSNSLYHSYVFLAYNSNGGKEWEFVNDSCLSNCSDNYNEIVPIGNNGAIFIGYYNDITGGQLRLKRIDKLGNLLWQQYWLTPFIQATPVKAILDSQGNLVVGLSAQLNLVDLADFALAKFDTTNGYLAWHLEIPDEGTLANPLTEVISDLAIDGNDNVYGCGSGIAATAGVSNNYYFKIDANGNLVYRSRTSFNGLNTSIKSIHADGGGSMYLMGVNSGIAVIEKRNRQSGNLVWSSDIRKDSSEISNVDFVIQSSSIFALNNFRYHDVGGVTWKNNHYLVSKMDTSGAIIWSQDYFTTTDSIGLQDGTQGASQIGTCNNNYYVLSTQHSTTTDNLLILHKFDENGTTVWYDTAIANTTAGNFSFDRACDIYLGRSFSRSSILTKYSDSFVNVFSLGKPEQSFKLFPNPASEKISIRFENNIPARAKVVFYNLLGVQTKMISLSQNETLISIEDLPIGINFVQLIYSDGLIGSKTFIKE